MATSPLVGGFSALIDVIQSQYHWSDEQVLGLSLARLNQIRDAIFIRSQADMYARHLEIEWMTKHLALTLVNTTLTDNKSWKKAQVKAILEWDMDATPQAKDAVVDPTLSSDEAIEAMWAEGAARATAANLEKPSFMSLRLG